MSILWDISKANEIEELPFPIITEGTQDCGNGVYLLKAGTPISEDREVANDGDAAMLVAEDFYFYSNSPAQPKLVECITGGYVDLNAAEAASGLTYTDAAKSALEEAGITLVDGKLETGGGLPEVDADDNGKVLTVVEGAWAAAAGGSGGGGVLVVTATLTADGAGTCDKTMGEIWTAAQTMPVILVENLAPVGIIGITQAAIKYTSEPSYILRGVNTNYRATSLDDYPSADSGGEPGRT